MANHLCDVSINEDNCYSAISVSKVGFSFLFFSVLLQVAFCAGLLGCLITSFPTAWTKRTPTTGTGVVLVSCMLIGTVCAVQYPIKMLSAMMDECGMQETKMGWGGVFLIFGLIISAIATASFFYFGKDDDNDIDTAVAPAAADIAPYGEPQTVAPAAADIAPYGEPQAVAPGAATTAS